MELPDPNHRTTLKNIARRAMLERGLLPDFSLEALSELERLHAPDHASPGTCDLRSLLWSSIDNDESRDLDQLSVAESTDSNKVKILRRNRGCGLFN